MGKPIQIAEGEGVGEKMQEPSLSRGIQEVKGLSL